MKGATGDTGAQGDPGLSTATAEGTITNSVDGAGIADVSVSFNPAAVDPILTSSDGTFSVELPVGSYTVTISATGYETVTQSVSIAAGVDATISVELTPTSNVVVNAGSDATGAPGADVSLSASVTTYDGSSATSYSWTQVSGVPVTITDGDTASPTITLADMDSYKEAVVEGTQAADRISVLGINPYALEEGTTAVLKVTVTTSSGTYTDTVNVVADTGLTVTSGLGNVGLGVPQLLQAASGEATYSWSLTEKPGTSTASIVDADTRWPIFTPDAFGTYELTEASTGGVITLNAGRWAGAITGLDQNGRPTADNCEGCHSPTGVASAAAMFDDWRKSGHAEIFSQNIDMPDNHWSLDCASCHTVGYNTLPSANNNGFDDYIDAAGWTVPKGAPGNYAAMLDSSNAFVQKLGSLANVQCESCHGPNNSPAHTNPDAKATRISLAAEVCGRCHGEPLRHGRFQQWQESKHASMDLVARGVSNPAHCGRCHTAEGFLAWVDQEEQTGDFNALLTSPPTLTNDNAHSVTCATCHDPHKQGTTSGEPNTATVRVSGDLPMTPAGFDAPGVGNGAVCMTCHNTRNGAHNDMAGAPTNFSAPHAPSQGDVLMGENAYFVTVGNRSPHSYIENTCTNCHMELTPPPDLLSYNRSGTNHTFEASMDICSNCHGEFDGGTLQSSMQTALNSLAATVGSSVKAKMNAAGPLHLRAYDSATDLYSSTATDATGANVTFDPSTNPVLSVVLTSGHGQAEFEITLTNPIDIDWVDGSGAAVSTTTVSEFGVQVRSLFVDDGGGGVGASLYDPSGNVSKAFWNYMLLANDGSLGVHNPGFYMDVINATKTQDFSN